MGVNHNEMLMDERKDRTIYYDCLRIIAMFSVIVLHVSAKKWREVGVETSEWQVMNFYDSIVRWSVPVFVMISGALFLKRDYSIEKIYKKNIVRIVVAFIFWSMLYAVMSMLSSQYDFKWAIKQFFQGKYHMWFLFMIVGLYMIVPLVKQITASKKLTQYFLVLSLVFTSVLPQAVMIISLKLSNVGAVVNTMLGNMSFHFTLGYVSYFVCGYYLSNADITKRVKRIIYFLGICGFVATIICTSVLSVLRQEPQGMFYGYFSVNVMLESIAVFVFVRDKFDGITVNKRMEKAILNLSKYSFGVYLVHIMVLEQLDNMLGLHALSFHPIISVPVISVLVFIISCIISGIMNHIPFLKYTV